MEPYSFQLDTILSLSKRETNLDCGDFYPAAIIKIALKHFPLIALRIKTMYDVLYVFFSFPISYYWPVINRP